MLQVFSLQGRHSVNLFASTPPKSKENDETSAISKGCCLAGFKYVLKGSLKILNASCILHPIKHSFVIPGWVMNLLQVFRFIDQKLCSEAQAKSLIAQSVALDPGLLMELLVGMFVCLQVCVCVLYWSYLCVYIYMYIIYNLLWLSHAHVFTLFADRFSVFQSYEKTTKTHRFPLLLLQVRTLLPLVS